MSGMQNASSARVSPRTLLAVALVGAVLLSYLGWRAFAGSNDAPGPPKKVTAGMYDLRAEAAKARVNQAGAVPNGR